MRLHSYTTCVMKTIKLGLFKLIKSDGMIPRASQKVAGDGRRELSAPCSVRLTVLGFGNCRSGHSLALPQCLPLLGVGEECLRPSCFRDQEGSVMSFQSPAGTEE